MHSMADVARADHGLAPDAKMERAWLAHHAAGSAHVHAHVVVAVPSLSMGESLMAHYGARVPSLEERYLLDMLMLGHDAGCELIFCTAAPVDEAIVDYYAGLAHPDDPGDVLQRLHLLRVRDLEDDASPLGTPSSPAGGGSAPLGVAPQARPLVNKVLESGSLLTQIRDLVGDRDAYLEPWNVTDREIRLGQELGLSVHGTAPQLWPLGIKSAGRELFQELGIPVPNGVEHVRTAQDVIAAIEQIAAASPHVAGVVIKHDDTCSGDGNHVIRWPTPLADLDAQEIRHGVQAIPGWFLQDLLQGGVVEELLSTEHVSPSVQLEITPAADVHVLSTHDQVLDDDTGQIYKGCRFPASSSYAATIAAYARTVTEDLATRGVRGRLSVDFVGVRTWDEMWDFRAIEVNLRKGGTSHPFDAFRRLNPGTYDEEEGRYLPQEAAVPDSGWVTPRPGCYVATDNLHDPSWTGVAPGRVIQALRARHLEFDPVTGGGVVLHMLTCLAVDGRLGLTAIATSYEQADALVQAVRDTIDSLV